MAAARTLRAAQPRDTGAPWLCLGPDNVPGRIGCLAISQQDSRILYAGSAAGGVFKTVDGGLHWTPLWSEQASLAIGGLAVAPSSHDVVYAATGEWEGDVSSTKYHHFAGVGVYRTINGGAQWTLSSIPSQWTAAVAVDPTDPDRVFVAGDRSLHRSRDGGRSWDTSTGQQYGILDGIITDVAIDPDEPQRIYVGVHKHGVRMSVDGGNRWDALTLPDLTAESAASPKLALGRRGSSGTQFLAVLTNGFVFTSTDGGRRFESRQRLPTHPSYVAWCTVIAVHPEREDIILAGHIKLWRSESGAREPWVQVGGRPVGPVHDDQQMVVFDTNRPDHVYVATDGGVFESSDAGQRWQARTGGLVTTQCYTVAVSRTPPLRIGITTQDNGAYQGDGGPNVSEIDPREGGWIEYDPTEAETVYLDIRSTSGPAPMRKWIQGGASGTWQDLGIESDAAIREALSIAPANPSLLLAVESQGRLVRSTTGGLPPMSWQVVLAPPGVRIVAVEFASSTPLRAYAASDGGRIWYSETGGQTWQELPNLNVPQRPVNDIEVDPRNPLRVFVAFGTNDATFDADISPVWRGDVTGPAAATWTDVSGNPPKALSRRLAVTGIAIDPRDSNTLYASHLLGVHKTTDGGRSWEPFDNGLPNCFVSDLDLHGPSLSLYAATMGRGVYRRAV